MRSVGIIVEYNPFHNGHKYHLDKARELGKADIVIGVMSGDFVQRGEPASFNRWERAELAIKSGIDLLIELPVFYSTQNAEIFARGGINILKELQVKTVVFGSESENIEGLKKIVDYSQSDEFKERIKSELKKGVSYPTAAGAVLNSLGIEYSLKSNDILGVEYLRAAKDTDIELIPIKRIGAGYHEKSIDLDISSATGVRETLMRNNTEIDEIERVVPKDVYNFLKDKIERDKEFKIVTLREFYPLIRYEIINNFSKLKNIQDIEEGLDIRLYNSGKKNREYESFFREVISKRYTTGRVQRVLIHILIGLTKEITDKTKNALPYIRVLGFSQKGREYLKQIKKLRDTESGAPVIISSLSNIRRDLEESSRELLEFNERASLIYKMIREYEERKIPIIQEEKTEKTKKILREYEREVERDKN